MKRIDRLRVVVASALLSDVAMDVIIAWRLCTFSINGVLMLHLPWLLFAIAGRPGVYPKEGGGFVRRDYELALILNPEVNEEETRAFLDRVEQIVTTNDGQVVKVNQWGRRRLAYPIERQRDGLYTFIDMILTPEAVSELDRTLKVSEVVLRHMVKKRDPKAVQKEREDREAREQQEREAREAREAAQAASESAAESVAEEQQAPEVVAATDDEVPALSATDESDIPPAVDEPVEA
jgi:small subunit ribosomal protein S6